jgi:hypothetical protein
VAEELKEILASEILDKIQKGEPVEYDHVIVKGDLDLGKLDNLPTQRINRRPYLEYYDLPETSKVVALS